jgi:hypothetical protein
LVGVLVEGTDVFVGVFVGVSGVGSVQAKESAALAGRADPRLKVRKGRTPVDGIV